MHHEESITLSAGRSVKALVSWPETPRDVTFLYAPGAGSNIEDPFGRYVCRELASHGVRAVRFQFPYQEAKQRAPDKPAVLEETWRAAIAQFSGVSTIAGGRSMGGRIASQVVAQGAHVDGLALFAYPLHPLGKPERRRDEHLPELDVPVLFCSGSRDGFASPEELQEAATLAPRATVHLLAEADHGFKVSATSGRSSEEVYAEALSALREWIDTLG